MGTRNLTMVIYNNETKIAQYGQWDGYPSGQGSTVLTFLNEISKDEKAMNKFKSNLDRCKFIENSKRKEKEMENFMKSIGVTNGWMNGEQAAKYHKKYPYLTRDNGADILNMIYNDDTDESLWLNNSEEFAGDSLFCEWAYIIDLDKNKFEVYEGFNTSPLTINDRFYNLSENGRDGLDQKYYPIRIIKSYDLDNLPEYPDQFVEEIEELVKEN